jgi:hypothetical protein
VSNEEMKAIKFLIYWEGMIFANLNKKQITKMFVASVLCMCVLVLEMLVFIKHFFQMPNKHPFKLMLHSKLNHLVGTNSGAMC